MTFVNIDHLSVLFFDDEIHVSAGMVADEANAFAAQTAFFRFASAGISIEMGIPRSLEAVKGIVEFLDKEIFGKFLIDFVIIEKVIDHADIHDGNIVNNCFLLRGKFGSIGCIVCIHFFSSN